MIYYVFDPETKVQIDTVSADVQPDHSTTVSPFDSSGNALLGAWFDEAKQVWQAPERNQSVSLDEVNQKIADLQKGATDFSAKAKTVESTLQALGLQVAKLVADKGGVA